jgi:predicted acyl esterase
MDDDSEEIQFRVTFTERTTIVGASKATLYVSCPDHDDLDVFVQLRKADNQGTILRYCNIPLKDLEVSNVEEVDLVNVLQYLGPTGILRGSHRKLDPVLSKPHWPAHDHTREEKITPGTIVKLEIGIWAAAMQFEPGEQLALKVAGHQMTLAEFKPLRGLFHTGNKGRHFLHFGGSYGSHVQIPIVLL